MEAVAVAALAAIVEHDHARVLDELVRENIQLRQQLEQQRLRLEQQQLQALDNAALANIAVKLGRKIHRLSGTIAWALHDVQMGEIETAEQRLSGCFEDGDSADDSAAQ